MAFRAKAAIVLVFIASQGITQAQELSFRVRHDHWRKGNAGTLTFAEDGIRWEEDGHAKHSRSWFFPEIQRLELSPESVRILTYEDVGWQLGRDREYVFDHLPSDLATRVHPFLSMSMDQRYLAHLADPEVKPTWEVPGKLLLGRSGSNGQLKVAVDHIVFAGAGHGESRTWKLSEITEVNSEDPFELTLTTIEGENRIQLKEALSDDRYQELWRRVSSLHGLNVFGLTNHEHGEPTR